MVESQARALPFRVMSVPSGVWSRSVRLETASTPLLYDVRGRLLNALRVAGPAERFRVREGDIAVVYEGPSEMHVSTEAISFLSYEPAATLEPMLNLLEIIEEAVSPRLRTLVGSFQHLVEIPHPPKFATAESARLAMGELAERVGVTDYANLVDGVDRESGLVYQAEFGVINADEAPFRLARFAGRTQAEPAASMDLIMEMTFPKSAVFVDSRWEEEELKFSLADRSELVSSLHAFEAAADRLASQISEIVTPSKSEKKVKA